MKRAIILQSQHFLKRSYTYNFFRSTLKFNAFFLKNNFFLFKFFKVFKFFFFINFFLQKKILFSVYTRSFSKENKPVKLKNKFVKYKSSYGQNYILIKPTEAFDLSKSTAIVIVTVELSVIKQNYIGFYNYTVFFKLFLLKYNK
jgi:hypothetical protein